MKLYFNLGFRRTNSIGACGIKILPQQRFYLANGYSNTEHFPSAMLANLFPCKFLQQ